ncbi:MAG: aminoacyl-tRNA hydrolase [Elusimicrobia bacterium CG11_big_fil_rev_8_21_14_0_20_64_6]|nr:MAG: aminoacyl-tRNA hydrolase [Elusimicrobia bacterium CG11_big_fil_rev_8_21_14_0_20_64_6]
MALKLVVGLGNPGPEYEKTRHNVGFRLADRLVGEAGFFWRDFKGLGVAAKTNDSIWVAKPMTFMNLSGEFVWKFAAYHNIALADILIVYDEIALPLGKIRIRKNGSAGGQKGMLSIIQHFGTDSVSRLRIGIGPQPERMDAAAFVLGRFNKSEEGELDAVLDRAAEAVGVSVENGIDVAMNRYNPAT